MAPTNDHVKRNSCKVFPSYIETNHDDTNDCYQRWHELNFKSSVNLLRNLPWKVDDS